MVRYEIHKNWNGCFGIRYRIYDNAIADWVKNNNRIIYFTAAAAKQWMCNHGVDKDNFMWR